MSSRDGARVGPILILSGLVSPAIALVAPQRLLRLAHYFVNASPLILNAPSIRQVLRFLVRDLAALNRVQARLHRRAGKANLPQQSPDLHRLTDSDCHRAAACGRAPRYNRGKRSTTRLPAKRLVSGSSGFWFGKPSSTRQHPSQGVRPRLRTRSPSSSTGFSEPRFSRLATERC